MARINKSFSASCKVMVAVMGLGLLSNCAVAQTKLTWPSPDEKVPSYTLEPKEGSMSVFRTPKDDAKLGNIQEVKIYETEHRVYCAPFRYKNVKVDRWMEYNDKGIEVFANGTITITEEKPIVSVTVVGSGCSTPNYNIVEWWANGENVSNSKGQLMKRSRIDNLKGQHNAWLQKAFTRDRFKEKGFETLEEANEFMGKLRRVIYGMTNGYYVPGSIMSGLYENTAYFRIGDVTVFGEQDKTEKREVLREIISQYDVHKIVIRAGGLDYEDPGSDRERYPADYSCRLIDVVGSNQMASIEVVKALTPDMDANAIGGTVNIITRSAFDYTGRRLFVNGAIGYADLGGRAIYQGQMNYSNRFGEKKNLGITFTANWDRADKEAEVTKYGWGEEEDALGNTIPFALQDFKTQPTRYLNTRYGLGLDLDYRLNDNNRFFIRGTYNKYDNDGITSDIYRIRMNKGDYIDINTVEGAKLVRQTKNRLEAQMQTAYSAGGVHQFGNLNLDYTLAYSYGEEMHPDELKYSFDFADRVDLALDLSDPIAPQWQITNMDNILQWDWNR